MKELFKCESGSRLYGTTTPSSDVDLRGIFVPSERDIILGTSVDTFNNRRDKVKFEKNYEGEVEEEFYSLKMFLDLVIQGQTMSLDIIFAPKQNWLTVTPEWQELLNNRHRLISKDSRAFVGYCVEQSQKFGLKGDRAIRQQKAVELLKEAQGSFPRNTRLRALDKQIQEFIAANPDFSRLVDIEQPGNGLLTHWEINGSKFSYNTSIKIVYEVMLSAYKKTGERVLKAARNNGVDFKAVSHAVRIASQSIELLTTGHITFPIPNAKHVTDIKLGLVPYDEVEAEIQSLVRQVHIETKKSVLPDKCDTDWITEFMYRTYRSIIK